MFGIFKKASVDDQAFERLVIIREAILREEFPLKESFLNSIGFLMDLLIDEERLNSETLGRAINNAILIDKVYAGPNGGGYPIVKTILAFQDANLTTTNSKIPEITFLLALTGIVAGIAYDLQNQNHIKKAVNSVTQSLSSLWKNVSKPEDQAPESLPSSACHRLV